MIHFISISKFKNSIQNFKFSIQNFKFSIQNFIFSIQNFKFSISNFKNLKYSTFTISNYLFCTLRFVVDRNINDVMNNYASKIIFNSFFNYFTSFQIYFKIILKLKIFVVIVIFFDLMMSNKIIIHRSFEIQFFIVIVKEFLALFIDAEFVKLFEKN